MSVKLLTEHHLEFVSLKRGCTGSFDLSKCHFVGNHMSRLNLITLHCLSRPFGRQLMFEIILYGWEETGKRYGLLTQHLLMIVLEF